MMTLNSAVASEHRADLLRTAAHGHLASLAAASGPKDEPQVTLRLADASDASAVHRLEALDESAPLAGRILLAVRDDEVVAALSLTDGQVAANPFVPTADAVALLRLRAAHLGQPEGRVRRRWPVGRRVRWA
jgi:hypothetical protein